MPNVIPKWAEGTVRNLILWQVHENSRVLTAASRRFGMTSQKIEAQQTGALDG
jgi:hypothetical protein